MNREIVDLIYEGPLEDEPWLQFLQVFRQQIDGVAASLNCRFPESDDLGFDVSVSEWDVLALRKHYAAEYHASNPFPYGELQPGKAYRWSDFVSAGDFHRSDFYRKFCAPAGYEFALCLCLQGPLGHKVWLHAVRDNSTGDFEPATLAWCESLAAHFQRSLRIFYRIKQLENELITFESAVHQLEIGALLLSREGEILSLNQNARSMLKNNRNILLKNKKIRLKPAALNEKFHLSISTLLASTDSAALEVLSIPRREGAPLGMLLRVFPGFLRLGVEPRPAIILYMTAPESRQLLPEQLLRSLFGLSRSEARLATLLVEGLKLAEAAAAMNIAEGSARIYCKRIFSKMGVGRQVELVKMVLKSVASLTPDAGRSMRAPAGDGTAATGD